MLDFKINYFGDETILYIYNGEDSSWEITFSSCLKVNYQTDANIRDINLVKTMKRPQLGYYGQDISLSKDEKNDGFIEVSMDLSIMLVKIVCKNITVGKVENNLLNYFWKFDK